MISTKNKLIMMRGRYHNVNGVILPGLKNTAHIALSPYDMGIVISGVLSR